jgi:hypothetical protein
VVEAGFHPVPRAARASEAGALRLLALGTAHGGHPMVGAVDRMAKQRILNAFKISLNTRDP